MAQSHQTKTVIRYTAVVAALAWSAAIALNGLHLAKPWLKGLSFLPLALTLLFGLYDQYLWKLKLILKFAKVPDLRGTWLGTFDSEWIDEDGGRQHSSGPVAIVVKQSFSEISIVLLSESSRSYSTLARLQPQPSGEWYLDYFYANTPYALKCSELASHNGSARFILPSVRPRKFTGSYWTDRLSRGSLELTWLSSHRVSELADAQNLPHEIREEII